MSSERKQAWDRPGRGVIGRKFASGPLFAFLIFMLIATFMLGAGTFVAVCLHRLKIDAAKERDFRARLSGTQFDKHPITLN